MKNIKDELQNIIRGDGQKSSKSLIKKTQLFLRANEITGFKSKNSQQLKGEEEQRLIKFITQNDFWYNKAIHESDFIAAGAEQKVYRLDQLSVLKLNDSIFYASWLDYLNNLLIHNYFFESTAYTLLGFRIINRKLFAVVSQHFIASSEKTNLDDVKLFLGYNGFRNTKNNDYYNDELGIIFEDLHDENVLTNNGLFYFIDTVFYLTDRF